MELIVKVRGTTLADIEEGLADALALVEQGFTRLPAEADPEGLVEFALRDRAQE